MVNIDILRAGNERRKLYCIIVRHCVIYRKTPKFLVKVLGGLGLVLTKRKYFIFIVKIKKTFSGYFFFKKRRAFGYPSVAFDETFTILKYVESEDCKIYKQ